MNIGELSVTAQTMLLISPPKTYLPLYPHDYSRSFLLFHAIILSQALSLTPFFISKNMYSISTMYHKLC